MAIQYQSYDAAKRQLTVSFDGKEVYVYDNVPQDVAEGLKYSVALGVSDGKYFNKYVKKYNARKVK